MSSDQLKALMGRCLLHEELKELDETHPVFKTHGVGVLVGGVYGG